MARFSSSTQCETGASCVLGGWVPEWDPLNWGSQVDAVLTGNGFALSTNWCPYDLLILADTGAVSVPGLNAGRVADIEASLAGFNCLAIAKAVGRPAGFEPGHNHTWDFTAAEGL